MSAPPKSDHTGDPRGRPRLAGEELPIEHRRAAIRTLASIKSQKRWTIQECLAELSRAGIDLRKTHSKQCENLAAQFTASKTVIHRCIAENYIPYRQLTNGIYLWMSVKFKKDFERTLREERMQENEKAVYSIKDLLAHGSDLNFEKARSLAGVYSLYRPSHVRPDDEILCARFIIGRNALKTGDKSEFNCSYESRYDDSGRERSTVATGKMIPHHDRLIAILTTSLKGSFILMFDDIAGDHAKSKVDTMGGIMIAAATGVSSAWPIYARRTDPRAFQFKTHTAEELPSLGRGPWDRLRRGNIYWADETFPGFGLADVRAPKQP